MTSQNSPVPNPAPPEPLINLAKVAIPVLSPLLPVIGPFIKRVLAVDALNAVHEKVAVTATPDTFFSTTLSVLGVHYEVSESDLNRIPETGPVVVVANHPLGGLDGVILGDLLRRRRMDVKIMANFALKNVRYAGEHMVFVDPFKSDTPKGRNVAPLRACLKHLKAGGLLAVFPGNKVSHFQWKRREIADTDWVPHIAAIIRRGGASVVPVFLQARNSTLFNVAGMIHPLIRTALLPREFVRQGRIGKPVQAHIGAAISHSRLKRCASDEEMIRFLRVYTYFLGNRPRNGAPAEAVEFEERAKAAARVAEPLPPETLEADILALPPDACLLRQGDFEVYIGTWNQLPNIRQEIGRGREISFRDAGGGTLAALDLAPQDEYYQHLFLWNKKDRAVAGAYRLGLADEILAKYGPQGLICSGLFHFKPAFVKKLNPGLELGRSYVLPDYQKNYSSLLLLWAGVLAFIARHPKYINPAIK